MWPFKKFFFLSLAFFLFLFFAKFLVLAFLAAAVLTFISFVVRGFSRVAASGPERQYYFPKWDRGHMDMRRIEVEPLVERNHNDERWMEDFKSITVY